MSESAKMNRTAYYTSIINSTRIKTLTLCTFDKVRHKNAASIYRDRRSLEAPHDTLRSHVIILD